MSTRSRIAVGRVWQETNTFSEARTTMQDFRRHRFAVGQARAGIMSESLPCECPGPSPSYLDRLDYRLIPRPIYPLDKQMEWRATR